MSIINDEMDRLIDEHFAYEVADDVDGVMSTLTDDIERDVVGFPGDAPPGADALRGFYAQLFGLLEQDGYKRLHALPCSRYGFHHEEGPNRTSRGRPCGRGSKALLEPLRRILAVDGDHREARLTGAPPRDHRIASRHVFKGHFGDLASGSS